MRICQPPENVSVGRSKSAVLKPSPAAPSRLELDAVAVVQPEAILQIAVAVQHRVVLGFGNRRVAEPLLERVHLGFIASSRRTRCALRRTRAARVVRPSCGR
jgi:hypothetical protein